MSLTYCKEDLVRIARRENNTKRGYLIVNPLQGKHVPVSPQRALRLFRQLAREVDGKYGGERILFIGFAETATAIGAQVAISCGMPYMQTTRENIPGADYLFFSEEHSHATEQKLVKNDIDAVIDGIDRIIFVEDEVTTGNTILHIADLLTKEYGRKISFSVISLLNGMAEEHLSVYEERRIPLHYLAKVDPAEFGRIAQGFAGDGAYYPADRDFKYHLEIKDVHGRMDARRLVDSADYLSACGEFARNVEKICKIRPKENVLVLGTEEFMYPALYAGSLMEQKGANVLCHSTTRSPIVTSRSEKYPLHSRYELASLYDKSRKNFIYNLRPSDRVIVLTDAKIEEKEGLNTLANALGRYNDDITIIRWR